MTQYPRRRFLAQTARAAAGLATVMPVPFVFSAMRSTRRVKIGQIGTGHGHAAGKMETLRSLPDEYEVVGMAEPDERLREAAEAQPAYRGLTWMTKEELLNRPDLEAVAVETRNAQLVPTAAECVAAGKHLHLDKPAGVSLRLFQQVMAEARRQRLVVQMGYMFRYNPAFKLCFQAAREGWLGELFELHGVIGKRVGPTERAALAEFSGGSMFELGCHLIDALATLLGRPDRITPFPRRTRPDLDDLTDNHLAVFEYPRATCTIRSSVVEVAGERRRQFTVCGQHGTVDIKPLEPPRLWLTLLEPQGTFQPGAQEVPFPPSPGRYHDELIDLARIIRGEKEADYSPDHDLLVCEMTLLASGMPLEP
jgi:predicted dehydrogenase